MREGAAPPKPATLCPKASKQKGAPTWHLWGRAGDKPDLTSVLFHTLNLKSLLQVALLDVMVQREEGLKRGKERMAAAASYPKR